MRRSFAAATVLLFAGPGLAEPLEARRALEQKLTPVLPQKQPSPPPQATPQQPGAGKK